MLKNIPVSSYHSSILKKILDCSLSVTGLILLSPIFLFISIVLAVSDGLPIFFLQKRRGLNGKIFKIIKFRTMKRGSEMLQKKYACLNEADGPVFKIKNDPRCTRFGSLLCKTGLDELPQMVNVLKGNMSIVGPRPFPINEADQIPKQFKIRELVKPGITSTWVISGAKHTDFNKWMEMDKKYIEKATFMTDIKVIQETIIIIGKEFGKNFKRLIHTEFAEN